MLSSIFSISYRISLKWFLVEYKEFHGKLKGIFFGSKIGSKDGFLDVEGWVESIFQKFRVFALGGSCLFHFNTSE